MNLINQHGSDHQKRVAEFMRGAGQAVPHCVAMPDGDTRLLRARLILEEALETIEALGVSVMSSADQRSVGMHNVRFAFNGSGFDMIETIDGCCDLSVVLQGTLLACGLPDTPFIEEVDAANLRKLDGGYKDAQGKWRKPASWVPPNIPAVLSRLSGG